MPPHYSGPSKAISHAAQPRGITAHHTEHKKSMRRAALLVLSAIASATARKSKSHIPRKLRPRVHKQEAAKTHPDIYLWPDYGFMPLLFMSPPVIESIMNSPHGPDWREQAQAQFTDAPPVAVRLTAKPTPLPRDVRAHTPGRDAPPAIYMSDPLWLL